MSAKLKIEIAGDKHVLEVYESEPGKLAFVMYPDDLDDNTVLDVSIATEEFTALLKKLLG